MKRLFLLVAVLAGSTMTFAQEKGDMYIGASLNFAAGSSTTITTVSDISDSETTPNSTSFGISAEYGYFVAKNFRVALSLGYEFESQPTLKDGDSWSKSKASLFCINPNVAYYVRLADRFYYTPEVGADFGFGSVNVPISRSSSMSQDISQWGIYAHFLALEFRATEHFALGCSCGHLAYTSSKMKRDQADLKVNTFKFDFGSCGVFARFYL